jgi:DNA-binding CsgD family transcriptional regulator
VSVAVNRTVNQRVALSAADLRELLALAGTLQEIGGREASGDLTALLELSRRLVGCDDVTYVDPDIKTGLSHRYESLIDEYGDCDDDTDCPFWALYWTCQQCCYRDVTGDVESITMTSDFYTLPQLRSHPMYTECTRATGMTSEMTAHFAGSPGHAPRLLFWRAGADFGERDRLLVALLKPHLEAALHRLAPEANRSPLTPRQQALLRLVAEGMTNRQVARRLGVSEGTVRKHLENIYARLGVQNRAGAVAMGQAAAPVDLPV